VKLKQFAALPYRMRDADLEILLITTRKKRRWSVPKGWPIKRSAPHQTAATEAYEEAGVYGKIGKSRIEKTGRCFAMCRSSHWRSKASRVTGAKRMSEPASGSHRAKL
jgi:8-oxo-dGTP pyrophosphatase MutT (NUDIX family)